MTLEELNALFDLRAELEELTEIRRSLMDAATKTTIKLTGMPHGSGVTDKIGGLASEIADFDRQIERVNTEIAEKEAVVSAWIDTVPAAKVQLVLRLRFLRGLQWKEIAPLMGKYRSEESVRNCVYRYLHSAREDTRSNLGAKQRK